MSSFDAGPWAICDRCGFKCRLRKLRKEWTGNMVCKACWDAKPPEHRPPNVRPEGNPLPNARPDPVPVFRDDGDPGGSDL